MIVGSGAARVYKPAAGFDASQQEVLPALVALVGAQRVYFDLALQLLLRRSNWCRAVVRDPARELPRADCAFAGLDHRARFFRRWSVSLGHRCPRRCMSAACTPYVYWFLDRRRPALVVRRRVFYDFVIELVTRRLPPFLSIATPLAVAVAILLGPPKRHSIKPAYVAGFGVPALLALGVPLVRISRLRTPGAKLRVSSPAIRHGPR